MVIVATYTGNLVALLTVSTTSAPVDTLYDLVHTKEYKTGLVKGQALVQVLKVGMLLKNVLMFPEAWNKFVLQYVRVGSYASH